MKIDPHSPVYAPSVREKLRKKLSDAPGGFSGLLGEIEGESETAATDAPARVAAPPMVGGILALQEVSGDETRRGRALKRGHEMLDALEDLRLSILIGEVSPEQLHIIQARMQTQKETVKDPQLQELMNEIEIRAAVELAKRGL